MTVNLAEHTAPTVDTAALRAEIEATRDAFQSLVRSLPEESWRTRRPGSSWTGRELLEHLTFAIEQLPKEIESAKRSKGMFNYPKLLADHGSYWLTKWEARKSTRDSIIGRYDGAIARTLLSLEAVEPAEWSNGARFYGEGFYSVADLFHTPAKHFEEHATHLKVAGA